MKTIDKCRVCESKDVVGFFDLGNQPLANSLLDSATQPEEKYSLSLSYCKNCSLVQLNETIPPEVLFKHYVWVTGTSKGAQEQSEIFYKDLVARTTNPKEDYVLEIASNDGTFLKPFMRDGYKVLGVDPAENITKMANDAGVPTEALFFSTTTADDIVARHGKAAMIFARNVLPHVANTRDFVEGMAKCLRDDGTVAVEVHYARVIQQETHYDSIYHEHLCYFTVKSLARLLADFGLNVFDVGTSPISGGALIVYAKKSQEPASKMLTDFREQELTQKTNEFESWDGFAKASAAHRDKLLGILSDVKARGLSLIGWGASARSSTMLNFCGIGTDILPAIIDLNPLKQGKFTAGTHIPIEGADEVMATQPQAIFLLAWNFRNEIKASLKEKYAFTGECIVPLPGEPRIEKI